MIMRMFTSLLVVGGGPGALAVAEIASGFRLDSLVIGHLTGTIPESGMPVELDDTAAEALSPHGVLDVLRPFLARVDPPTVAPEVFETVLRQHGAADMNVTMYDRVEVIGQLSTITDGVGGATEVVISDGQARFEVQADAVINTSNYSQNLSDAINQAARDVASVLEARRA